MWSRSWLRLGLAEDEVYLGEHGAAQDRAGYNKQGDDDHGNGGLLVTPS